MPCCISLPLHESQVIIAIHSQLAQSALIGSAAMGCKIVTAGSFAMQACSSGQVTVFAETHAENVVEEYLLVSTLGQAFRPEASWGHQNDTV